MEGQQTNRFSLSLCLCAALLLGHGALAFSMLPSTSTVTTRNQSKQFASPSSSSSISDPAVEDLRAHAEQLLAQARALRSELPPGTTSPHRESATTTTPKSPWRVQTEEAGFDYRLYVDIGREDGSWMDPQWGASGRRIEFTLDVRFLEQQQNGVDPHVAAQMVTDNFAGRSSPVCRVVSGPAARLNRGFQEMACHHGAYRIDTTVSGWRNRNRSPSTLRFFIAVDGTPESDVWIPPGNLYFSLPTFGGLTQLSAKEGIVSVRQYGWHTGWWRQESRIVGVFRAVKLEEAKKRDNF